MIARGVARFRMAIVMLAAAVILALAAVGVSFLPSGSLGIAAFLIMLAFVLVGVGAVLMSSGRMICEFPGPAESPSPEASPLPAPSVVVVARHGQAIGQWTSLESLGEEGLAQCRALAESILTVVDVRRDIQVLRARSARMRESAECIARELGVGEVSEDQNLESVGSTLVQVWPAWLKRFLSEPERHVAVLIASDAQVWAISGIFAGELGVDLKRPDSFGCGRGFLFEITGEGEDRRVTAREIP